MDTVDIDSDCPVEKQEFDSFKNWTVLTTPTCSQATQKFPTGGTSLMMSHLLYITKLIFKIINEK